MDPISNALSGLSAASKRIEVSANNIANIDSTTSVVNGQRTNQPFVPQEVVQSSRPAGGVSTSLRDVSPPSVPVFDQEDPAADENGFVQVPNVNLDQEVANQLAAANNYKANLAVIRRANETYQTLLDIQS